MSDLEPSSVPPPSKEGVYLAVIVLLAIGCVAAIVVAMQESVARRNAEAALRKLRASVTVRSRPAARRRALPRKGPPPPARSRSAMKPYRSLVTPIPPGALIGSLPSIPDSLGAGLGPSRATSSGARGARSRKPDQ